MIIRISLLFLLITISLFGRDFRKYDVYCDRPFLELCGFSDLIYTRVGDFRASGYLNFKVGNTVYSMHLYKGLIHGALTIYVNGLLKERSYYYRGRHHGSDSKFYNDGSIREQDIYVQGFKISGYKYNKRGYKKEYNLKEIEKYNKYIEKRLI